MSAMTRPWWPRRWASSASHTGAATSRINAESLARKFASIARAEASRPVALSAIIQCGTVHAESTSPMRASALSASSSQRADRDAAQLEAREHRGGVLHVDVEVGQRRDERRREIAEAPVVEIEHRVELAAREVEHRPMPPEVMQERALAGPMRLEAG